MLGDNRWTESLAVGSKDFVENIRENLNVKPRWRGSVIRASS